MISPDVSETPSGCALAVSSAGLCRAHLARLVRIHQRIRAALAVSPRKRVCSLRSLYRHRQNHLGSVPRFDCGDVQILSNEQEEKLWLRSIRSRSTSDYANLFQHEPALNSVDPAAARAPGSFEFSITGSPPGWGYLIFTPGSSVSGAYRSQAGIRIYLRAIRVNAAVTPIHPQNLFLGAIAEVASDPGPFRCHGQVYRCSLPRTSPDALPGTGNLKFLFSNGSGQSQ